MNNEQLLKEIDRLKLKIISLKKLDNSNSQFAADFHNSVVESAPDAIISINSRGNIIYWNKSAERLFGFSKYEILGSSLTKIIPRRFRNDHVEGLNKALTSSKSEINGKAIQLIGLHKYGREFPVEITLSSGFTDNMRYFTGIIRDITERLEAQKLIKESQELYSLLVNTANDGIYITTPEYLEFVNPAFERFSGYKFEEVCNETFSIIRLIHPDDHALIKQRTKDRKAGKEIESKYEFKFVTKSGDIRFVEVNTVPLPDKKGKVLGILRDITERKLFEKELSRSNEMFKVLFDNGPDAYYLHDLTGTFIDGNRAAEKMLGYKKEELIGKNFLKLKLLNLSDIPKAAKLLGINFLGKSTGPDEFVLNRKDGSQVTVEILTHPVEIEGKRVVLGAARDITEKKKTEKALAESEQKYRHIIEEASDIVYTTNVDGFFTFANAVAERVTGFSMKEILNMQFIELIAPEVREESRLFYRKQLEEKIENTYYEFPLITKDGETIWLGQNVQLLTKDNNIVGVQAVARDITDRKKLERKLEEAFDKSEDQYKTLMDTLNDGIGQLDNKGKIIFGNKQLFKMLGYTEKELIGKFVKDLYPEDIRSEMLEQFAKRNAGKESSYESELLKKDGTRLPVLISPKAMFDEHNNFMGSIAVISDISRLKNSEHELEFTMAQLSLILDSQPVVTYLSRAEGDFGATYISNGVLEMTGYRPEEFISNSAFWSSNIHPDDVEKVFAELPDLFENGVHEHEYRWKIKDGTYRWFFDSLKLVKDKNGNPTHIIGMWQDITERKKSEKLIHESEQNYKTVVETMSDGLIRLDVNGNIIFANKKLLSMLGYSKEELLSKNVSEIFRKERQEQFVEELSKRKKGINEPFETEFTRKDGKYISVIVSPETIYDKDGAFNGAVGVITDITDMQNMTTKLKESISVLKSTMDATYDAIFVVDNNQTPIYYNQKFLNMMEFTETKIAKSKFKERMKSVVHLLKDPNQFKHKIEYYQKNPEEEGFDLLEFVDGRVFERHSIPRKIDGKIVGRIWSFKDVTDTKKEEQMRLAAEQRLETAKRMESLGVLAGGVAHDLNNILGPMVAYPDLLAGELPEGSPMLEDLAIIKESAVRAAEVVSDLLTLARRGNYKMHPLNLNDVIKSHRKSLAHSTIQDLYPNTKLKTYLSSKLRNIFGSAPHLSKVVMNMINNSYEAMPYGGTLVIKTYNRSLEKQLFYNDDIPKGNYVVLEFKDSGIGMNEDEISKIFEPFFTKKEMGRSGSGLGLSVVWGVVKDHKGYIDITSEEGVGTKFNLYFPVTSKKQDGKTNYLSTIRGSETIIVIDDEKKQRDVAQKVLASLGYKVKCFETGTKGINYLKKNGAALIILDMIMKNEDDGLRIYRRILKTNPNQKTIIVSGFSETEHVREARKLGVKTFIKKPFTVDSLGKTVRTILDK